MIDGKGDLTFSVEGEVIPSFELQNAEGLALTKHVVEPAEADINEAIDRLASQYKSGKARMVLLPRATA